MTIEDYLVNKKIDKYHYIRLYNNNAKCFLIALEKSEKAQDYNLTLKGVFEKLKRNNEKVYKEILEKYPEYFI